MNHSISCGLFAGAVACALLLQIPVARANKEEVLYSFCSQAACADGRSADNGLIAVHRKLYGTASFGGGSGCGGAGCGTVFTFDPRTGIQSVLYSFKGGDDGAVPNGLIRRNRMLYGTTTEGGGGGCFGLGCGTVFALEPQTGTERVLHAFSESTEGVFPYGTLISLNGVFYGTTENGGGTPCNGNFGCGTVFGIDPDTGIEKVLYTFCSQQNCTDGAQPEAGLTKMNGILYGTTLEGGGKGCDADFGCGTVFALDPQSGTETVLHAFGGGKDGRYPSASLIHFRGILYGTTFQGGGSSCYGVGCGTVFALDPQSGATTLLHSFGGKDGAYPSAPLTNVRGTLYGTTGNGGRSRGGVTGYGTVFALDPQTAALTMLHTFAGSPDGNGPYGALLHVPGGRLYGTTDSGGAHNDGTIFSIRR